ncbi:MAG: PepSY domain-containing protein [Nannocystaceae bacterium]|nr:PepSY domain-containing protein [Myxococcales bacterium]
MYASPRALLLSLLCAIGCDARPETSAAEPRLGAQVDIDAAIRSAEARTPGVTLAAELVGRDDGRRWEVVRWADGAARRVTVDPGTGEVLAITELERRDLGQRAAIYEDATLDAHGAIAAALRHVDGAAIEFEVEGDAFEVEIVTDEGVREVVLAKDGALAAIEDEDEDDDDEDEDDDDDEDEDD